LQIDFDKALPLVSFKGCPKQGVVTETQTGKYPFFSFSA